ncbi:MAG: hypothetical protein WCK05_14555 [Planctomycetota bacterium]
MKNPAPKGNAGTDTGPAHIPLLPRHGIRLFVVDGDGPRFANLFRETWQRLPLWARCRLLRYWRTPFCKGQPRGMYPAFELISGKSDFFWRGDSGNAWGQCGMRGYSLAFAADHLAEAGETETRYTVAHELAHVYMFAIKDPSHAGDDATAEWAHDLVDEQLTEWGYDLDTRSWTP